MVSKCAVPFHVLTTPLLSDIIKSFKSSLYHLDWMDEESAQAAAEKVMDNTYESFSQ